MVLVGDFEPVFGKNVGYLRRQSGLTQKSLGVLVGTSQKYIQKIEQAKGFVAMDYRILMRLCEVFGVDIKNLARVDFAAQEYPFPVYADPKLPPVEERPDRGDETIII